MSLDTYIAAKAAFERHEAHLNAHADLLATLSQALRRQPGKMIFANTAGGLPMEASMSRDSLSFNGNDFKTPAQMQEMLAQWHKLYSTMMNEWHALSPDAQANVSPPDKRGPR